MTESPVAPLWTPTPDAVARASMTAFAARAGAASGGAFGSYRELWDWSIRDPNAFWSEAWDYLGVIGDRGETAFRPGPDIRSASFFPGARLNYAENLLRSPDDSLALVFVGEDGRRSEMSRRELADQVARLASALRSWGIRRGDRVAGIVANTPESVVAVLATATIGAIWSSCSPDFGADGVVDRFGQIAPRVLFATTGYFYNGRPIDIRARIAEVVRKIPELERVAVWDYAIPDAGAAGIPRAVDYEQLLAAHRAEDGSPERLAFRDPLFILFSSGTTGKPKCIAHSVGGVTIQHLKEHRLHNDFQRGDRVLYFTTCGWMMWNWLVSALASEAAIVLYDGNPTYPGPARLADIAESEKLSVLGVSAKYLDAVGKAGAKPARTHDLSGLRSVLSTGSPLSVEGFNYVYRDWSRSVHLGSISGGTDICGVFIGANPTLPVYPGELQCPYLGMDVCVYDESGAPVVGAPGELVCRSPHPSMPIGFWNDPDGAKYRSAYFEPWPDVWRHGDWIVETPRGGFVIAGRSDATLNPGGVRIGTAEIYRQAERLPEVVEALVIAQDWGGDVRIVLFVRLAADAVLDDEMRARIRERIRGGASPRHVPARILEVSDIPRTRSGKIVELAVRDVVHGRPVRNVGALANPEALDQFRDRQELRS